MQENCQFAESVDRWKYACLQCGYLKTLRDYQSVAQQVRDTAIHAERAQELKDKLKDHVRDLRVVNERNEELERTMQDLQEASQQLQEASQQELAMEKVKKMDALKLSADANKISHEWIAAFKNAEEEAQDAADAQWLVLQEAEQSAAVSRQESEALDVTLKDTESKLQREQCDKQAVGEVAKYWQGRHTVSEDECQAAIRQRDLDAEEWQKTRDNLDTTRVVKNQHRDSNEALEMIQYAERKQWEAEVNRLEVTLAEYKEDLAESRAILSRSQKDEMLGSDRLTSEIESERAWSRMVSLRNADLEIELKTVSAAFEDLRKPKEEGLAEPRPFVDEPLSDDTMHLYDAKQEVRALRAELSSQKDEHSDQYREMVDFNVQEHLSCAYLRQHLKEERVFAQEMRESRFAEKGVRGNSHRRLSCRRCASREGDC